ncbi:MAG: GNAT family N-acetyltransferase [Clostridiales bacterium]|nr:GNAT family N-acetyltransferase [Clostridiales bacterium]
MGNYFLKTERIGFSIWGKEDLVLAKQLWEDKDVIQSIYPDKVVSDEIIQEQLLLEVQYQKELGVQVWPIFELASGELIGCCGLYPITEQEDCYEIRFHLRKKFWGIGLASEAVKAVMDYATLNLKIEQLTGGFIHRMLSKEEVEHDS